MAVHTFIGKPSDYNDRTAVAERDWRVEYEGCVLQTYERNGYDDSDFYAIVWDEAQSTVKHVMYATTRGWTYANGADVDATPEAIAKAQLAMRESDIHMAMLSEEWDSTVPKKDRRVRVLGTGKNNDRPRRWKGEVIEADTEGVVFWIGVDGYNSTRWNTRHRLGVELDDGRKVFSSQDSFEVTNPEQYRRSEDEIREAMPDPSNITNFHRAVPGYANMVG